MTPLEARKEFLKEFQGLTRRWNTWDVWSDWLIMASSSIYNAIHRDPAVEDEYMRTAKKYDREELNTVAHLLGITVLALEAETHDFLGATFHELEVNNKAMGQFFTPFEVCRLMAKIVRPKLPRPGRVLRVSEPTCGSGSMVLAFHEGMMEAGAVQHRILYHLKDLDHRAWRMAYIQASLCGMAAEVELGDTLRMTTDRIWRTPAYYLHDMPTRLRIDAMMRALQPGDEHARETDRRTDRTSDGELQEILPEREAPERSDHEVFRSAVLHGASDPLERAPSLGRSPTSPNVLEADLPIVEQAPTNIPSLVVAPDLILPRPGENFSLF